MSSLVFMHNTRTRSHVAVVMACLLLSGCADNEFASALCDMGIDAARHGSDEQAVRYLSACLVLPGLTDQAKASALEARAWSRSQLTRYREAVQDLEASFRLRSPTMKGQFINYALYLRKVGRFQDSLDAVVTAERIDGGVVNMMTQYNKGWSLSELGRYAEAVEAFSKGVPYQPDYAFVYWRRGLAYEALGETIQARADFEKAAKLLIEQNKVSEVGDLLLEMREKLRQYRLDQDIAL